MKLPRLLWRTVTFVCANFCVAFLDASDAANSRDICRRDSPDTPASKTPGDNGFRIKFAGRPPPERYTAGQVYTVGLSGTYSNQKLLGFMLVAVPENARDETTTMGTFQHMSNGLTTFGSSCPHVITHTYPHPRNEVEILWTAPDTGAGCIEFRATVIQYKDIWYKDDGALTRVFCEDVGVSENNQSLAMIPDCCACGVGKYQMTFEGIWSRETHPKDFPFHKRLLHWSNVVGASHSKDYSVWQYGGYATKGVRETCEYGYPRTLEQEIRKHSESVRTVIKTPGIWWVDPVGLQQTRTARFSMDRKFHLFSVIAMIGPSPDWCVGVSALNLCLPNCSWAGDMDIDMLPWDAGTDDGIAFLSRNKKSEPQQKIHRITNTYPSNPSSPFFSSEPIKPLGTIRLRRIHPEAGSSGVCDNDKEFKAGVDFVDVGQVDEGKDETSGGGKKKKGNRDGEKEEAEEELTEKQLENLLLGPRDRPECIATEWSQWSVCSVSCGFGQRFRKRKYSDLTVNASSCDLALLESEICSGREQHCEKPEDLCSVTQWSDWSPCTVTCGRGIRERRRMYMKEDDDETCDRVLKQRDLCVKNMSCSESHLTKNFTAICTLEKDIGPCRGSFQRWYYDHVKHQCLGFLYGGCRGNNNRFRTQSECIDMCERRMRPVRGEKKKRHKKTHGKKNRGHNKKKTTHVTTSGQSDRPKQRSVSCKTSQWSEWSSCSSTCGKSYKYKRRSVTRQPQHGGKKCPRKLERRARCKVPRCKRADCQLGQWQAWTPCAKTCGRDSIQERTRQVVRQQRPGGAACSPRIERRYCTLPDCPTGQRKGGRNKEETPSDLTAETMYFL